MVLFTAFSGSGLFLTNPHTERRPLKVPASCRAAQRDSPPWAGLALDAIRHLWESCLLSSSGVLCLWLPLSLYFQPLTYHTSHGAHPCQWVSHQHTVRQALILALWAESGFWRRDFSGKPVSLGCSVPAPHAGPQLCCLLFPHNSGSDWVVVTGLVFPGPWGLSRKWILCWSSRGSGWGCQSSAGWTEKELLLQPPTPQKGRNPPH